MMDKTVEYYNTNAGSYFAQTAGADFSAAHAKFCAYLPARGRILDAGCGSGRDAAAFARMGYEAEGLDASSAMARLATEKLGVHVFVGDMATWQADAPYDGIWACASLLHLGEEQIRGFFGTLETNLKAGGALYVSVKTGGESGTDEKGRYMRYFAPGEVEGLLAEFGLEVLESWETGDTLGRDGLRWINVIGRKK